MFEKLKNLFRKAPAGFARGSHAQDKTGDELKEHVRSAQDSAYKGMMQDARRSHPGSVLF